ncbi:MAG: phosphoribosylglycinamide formyltransferase 1 [Actinobacteria bacterium]|nr:phosphoribosylglycinamide formyltransferase 1 [Actinomycetota bacterium]
MACRLVILASGTGTIAQAIIDAHELDIEVVAVLSDQVASQVLERARTAGIPNECIPVGNSRNQWNSEIIEKTAAFEPDLVVSAGFMRILPPDFVHRFPTINIHPSLLPDFPGAHAVRDALAAGVLTTGSTVHWVDAGVDTGPIITQMQVPVLPGDDEITLHERIKKIERGLMVTTIALILPTLEQHV